MKQETGGACPQKHANLRRTDLSFRLKGHCRERARQALPDNGGDSTPVSGPRSVCGCPRMTRDKWRVHKAFLKARFIRERALGRELTTTEELRLRQAVRRQCDTRLLPRKVKGDAVSERLTELERAVHSLAVLVESGMPSWVAPQAYDALNMIRAEVVALVDDVALRESCSHYRHQVRVMIPESSGTERIRVSLPDRQAMLNIEPGSRLVMACDDCRYRRELWFVDEFRTSPPEFSPLDRVLLARTLRVPEDKIVPLAFQSVWSRCLDPPDA